MTSQAAPGRLELVRAFTNTVDIDEGSDALADVAGLRGFLREQGLLDDDVDVEAADLAMARELRHAFRSVLADHAHEVDDLEAAVARLNRGIRASELAPRLTGADRWELVPAASGVLGALGVVLAAAVEAMTDGTWARLKICLNDTCQWAYYDHSRNRSGRWCSMAVCGNRMKVRAYRERTSD